MAWATRPRDPDLVTCQHTGTILPVLPGAPRARASCQQHPQPGVRPRTLRPLRRCPLRPPQVPGCLPRGAAARPQQSVRCAYPDLSNPAPQGRSASPAGAGATAQGPSKAATRKGRQGRGRRTALQAAPSARAVPAPRARPERGPRAGAPTRAERGAGRSAPRPGHKAAPREPASPAARGAAGLREPSDPSPARASQPRPPGAARRRRRRHFLPLAVAASPLSGYSIHLGPLQPAPRRASASTPPAGACGDCAAPGSPAARARPAATAHGRLENPTGAHAAPSARDAPLPAPA